MGKELEELIGITKNKIEYIKKQPKIDWVYLRYYEGVLNLVTRLEAIDNANPSEAMRKLEWLYADAKIESGWVKKHCITYAEEIEHNERIKPYYDTIKQALLKAQKQEKFIDIIKRKGMFISTKELNLMKTYEDYKNVINERKLQQQLMQHITPTLIDWDTLESTPFYTEKEFNIVKEIIK